MRTTPHLITLFAFIFLLSCKNEPKPAPPPEPAPVEKEKGTSVKAGKEGVEVESPDADVKITEDSASIEIPPK